MNMNLDDPKLTAFALDELNESERSAMAAAIAESPEAQRMVDETRELADALKNEFAAELELEGRAPASPSVVARGRRGTSALQGQTPSPANLIDIRDDPWIWAKARPLAIAAVIAMGAFIAGLIVLPGPLARWRVAGIDQPAVDAGTAEVERVIVTGSNIPTAEEVGPETEFAEEAPAANAKSERSKVRAATRAPAGALAGLSAAPPATSYAYQPLPAERRVRAEFRQQSGKFNTADYDRIVENPFLEASSNPLSTFSIDVDTASYSNIRRFINEGSLPPPDAVRVEEMVNYFTYDYAQPGDDKPFAVHVDVAGCPWETSHRLVRIGLKGREIPNEKRGASNLVFLLDVSGSMEPAERLPLVKQAMRLLVDKLTENDRVAIVVYAGSSGLVLPSTTGDHKERIFEAIENLQAGGSTNGAEGIELAYKIASENFIKGGVNRVILATDGDFNVGVTSQGDLIRLIEKEAKTGVFLSVLGVGTDNLKDSTMQKLADKGNGNHAYLDSLDEARKVLVQQMNGTLVTIAKDVKIQVEFNPARVASYRLIGYEKRMLRKEDFNDDKIDAGEIGAGHTVTALYEVVPAGAFANPAASIPPVDPLKFSASAERSTSSSGEMLTVKLRYKKPDGDRSELLERAVRDDGSNFAKASPDLKFAAAVAEFGMILRDSEHKGDGTLGAVVEWAQEGKGSDPNGYRAGFIELVRKARSLKKG